MIHSVPGRKNIKRKRKIIEVASRLFAEQGYEGTTTVQIVKEAGATEPLLYYHFKDKEEVFTSILVSAFDRILKKLDNLGDDATTSFERLKQLISIHFEIVEEMPYELVLAINTCPADLWGRSSQSVAPDPDHVCSENVRHWRDRIKSYLTDCLTAGITNGVKNAAVAFCQRSLVKQ